MPNSEKCLHELFAEQTRRSPASVAVVCGDERMTYEQLDRAANRLAQALWDRGVGPETTVGVCMVRSAWTIVAFLAILKAGGVYVPLDPEYPTERLGFMLDDAQVRLLLTSGSVDAALQVRNVDRLIVDATMEEGPSEFTEAPSSAVVPGNLACMFYTSGSTGTPKCVMLTHANIVNYFDFWRQTYLGNRPIRAHTQMTSFAFVIFVADVSRALFSGGTLVICPRETVLSPADLYELMVREGVNSAEFVPPILELLLEYAEEEGLSLEFLDLLVAGGDIWYARDFLRAQRLCGDETLMISAYGMTETSIDNATFPDGELEDPDGIVPIGRPALNTALYVLDELMRPVPMGAAGELYIGGLGVARGYHRRPELTAERFVPDPFDGRGGTRLYRSGDVAQCRPDGVLEILGRADNQVKVNGIRIELGEVEAALRGHVGVENAVVTVRGGIQGETCLVGHIKFADGALGTGDDLFAGLREFLAQRVPSHMVPAVMHEIDSVPLNAHGKVDRRSLAMQS